MMNPSPQFISQLQSANFRISPLSSFTSFDAGTLDLETVARTRGSDGSSRLDKRLDLGQMQQRQNCSGRGSCSMRSSILGIL